MKVANAAIMSPKSSVSSRFFCRNARHWVFLFGHDCVALIGPQFGCREPGQHNGVLDILRTGRDSVAESDVDLDPAACAVDYTEQHDAHASIVCIFADLGSVHGVGLKRYAIVEFERADFPEDAFDVREVRRAES